MEWYKKNFDSIFEKFPVFGDDSWDKSVQHSLLNLVSHEEHIKPGRQWSFIISAVCHIKAFQLSGYFGQPKLKTPKELTDDEALIGRMLVHLFMLMQFNTHGITESTDIWNKNISEFGNKTRVVGQGLYPTLCLLNHSCDNNVTKYYSGSKCIVIASKVRHNTIIVLICYALCYFVRILLLVMRSQRNTFQVPKYFQGTKGRFGWQNITGLIVSALLVKLICLSFKISPQNTSSNK